LACSFRTALQVQPGDWALYTDSPLRAFESELGVQAPLGFWDPLGLSADGDAKAFARRRSVEIKHGRICMLATMGYMTPELTGKFPGYLSPSADLKFADVPNGLQALGKVPAAGWLQIVAYMGFCEFSGGFDDYQTGKPGDKGWKPPLLATDDAETKTRRLNAEIANGRLAMMAIIGMFFQDGLTGSAYGDWSLYTDSPLRAFEGELGVQAPVGFFDPLGFTKDGDAAAFNRRRSTEIKHGRISMLATMGYITPELTGKFPGFLSPSLNLRYEDIPNGLAALSKVPLAGWFQIVLYCLYCEASGLGFGYFDEGERSPGDLGFKPPLLATDDQELKRKRLNAELANGRLAMMAIIGMFFQDGLTGSAWGDWALYTDSPLRAFENELGVQAPVGFFDPLGLTKDGDVASFKRRRETELKHGRVSMIAAMGYITAEYARFPGYLSPSENLKFTDIPNGLEAIAKVPAVGWVQYFLFCGFIEKAIFVHDPARAPGDYARGGVLGVPNGSTMPEGEGRTRKLNSELANGRLAMVAITGMMFQNGFLGTTGAPMWIPGGAFENELGVQAPVGFFDPLGLSADGDMSTFNRRRASEIKHGRISMLATMGYMTPELTGKFPGYLSYSLNIKYADVPNGLAAISKVPFLGWFQILLYTAFCEISAGYNKDVESGTPGVLGFKPPFLTSDDAETKTRRLNSEIANGRLAMMAIIGMFFQDGLTGSAYGDWSLYTDSPLRAFEGELGVQAPVGFWDPLGFTKDGDAEAFNRRRNTEIKHGRVSMLATMGYITPEVAGKFPGYLSPSLDLKYDDIPNGLAAISKVPGAGWLQIIAYCLYCESTGGFGYNSNTASLEPGNCGWKPPLLATSDPELRRKRLNAELANGRLAMMAIIGMFFQDGLTGSAWGDWALYTDSPLRAFENELGVQPPVGFWDPMGFAKDGDVDVFKRRREVELKHGRVSMFAAMGYIVPEYYKFPGYLSPSADLTFDDVPNGLAAISKVPALGWAQWFIFIGLVDFGLYRADPSRDPGDYANAGIMGVPNASGPMSDEEGRKRKLNAELANGRLAMVAIMGMMFQNGWIGTTGPSMWFP